MNQIRKNQSGCFTLPRFKTEVREIHQPVKLTQGLSGKKLQDDQRNATFIKLSQPERLTPYGKKEGSCKKNLAVTLSKPERLTPYLKSTQSCKKDTLLQNKTKNVRRNLDFAVSSRKEKTKLNDRKSLLLPPNTIKNTYIKRQTTFVLPQCRVLATPENKCPGLLKELKTCSSSAKNVASNIKHKKNNATPVIQHTLLGMPSTIDESGINIACSPQADLTCTSRNDVQGLNSDQGVHSTVCASPKVTNNQQLSSEPNANGVTKQDITKKPHLVNETKKSVFIMTNQEENAQSLSEIIETIAVPLPCDTDRPDDRVTVRKADLTALELRMSRVIDRLKEDLSEFTAVANIISTIIIRYNNTINAAGEMNNKDEKMDQQTTENLNENTVADVPEQNNSEAQPSRQVSFFLESESNKENEDNSSNVKCSENKFKTRRRSARLMAKSLSNLCSSNNDSFVSLENELNITHANSNAKCASIKKCRTPDMSKYKKMNKEPLKEYMALKSRMSCLVTPKTPKSFSVLDLGHDMCFESGTVKASISNKVLSEIFSLYEDAS